MFQACYFRLVTDLLYMNDINAEEAAGRPLLLCSSDRRKFDSEKQAYFLSVHGVKPEVPHLLTFWIWWLS